MRREIPTVLQVLFVSDALTILMAILVYSGGSLTTLSVNALGIVDDLALYIVFKSIVYFIIDIIYARYPRYINVASPIIIVLIVVYSSFFYFDLLTALHGLKDTHIIDIDPSLLPQY